MKDFVPKLPINWSTQSGLHYPSTLKLKNGEEIILRSYAEHHRIIKDLFINNQKFQ